MRLDLKDKRILHELDKNARQHNSEISKKVGLSKDSVGYRINKLEEQGIIRGHRTRLDIQKMGYTLYRVYLNLIDVSKEDLDSIIDFLKKEKNAWWIARLDGSWNFAFAYWAKVDVAFYEFYNKFSVKFRKHVQSKLINPVLNYVEFTKGYLSEERVNKLVAVGRREPIILDETDNEILKMLSKDARTQLVKIAQHLNVDSMTIFHRIRNLENKGIILGYKADIDVSKLGRDFYTVEIELNNFSNYKKIESEVLALKQTTAMSKSIGGYDIELDLEVENAQEYYTISDKLKDKFPEIREIKYFRVIENHKILYMPEE